MSAYASGSTIRLAYAFKLDGVETDPGAVTLTVTNPAGTATSYTYAGGTVTKDATGRYRVDVTPSITGNWQYLWVGTSPVAVSEGGGFTIESPLGNTLLKIEQEIAKTPGLGYATGICSAAGSTTTIVDTSGDSPFDPNDNANLYESWYAKIEEDSAATPLNVGEVRRLKPSGGYTPGSQTVTTAIAFSNATTATQRYGLYAIAPTRVGTEKGLDEYINEVLRNLKYRTLGLLTLVTDGDMETSGVTNWTASNTTLSKSVSSDYVFFGKQALKAVNTAVNGYARSALIPVAYGQTYDVLADVRVVTGTAKLQLYDETNSAEIDSATTSVIRKGYLWLDSTTIPSGCKQISVRLIGTGASDEHYWDNVSVRQRNATEMPLPSWLTDRDWLEDAYFISGGAKETTNDSYTADERGWPRVGWWDVLEDTGGRTPYRLRFTPSANSGTHLFISAVRPFAELSADDETTDADKDWAKAWCLAAIFKDKGNEAEANRWARTAKLRHRDFRVTLRRRRQMREWF